MKKIIPLIVLILLLVMFLIGCIDEEEKNNNGGREKDEISTHEDFFGTWQTLTGSGSFSEGNSIRFNNDFTYEKFWAHGSSIYHNGTWELKDILGETPKLILTQGENTYNYTYTF